MSLTICYVSCYDSASRREGSLRSISLHPPLTAMQILVVQYALRSSLCTERMYLKSVARLPYGNTRYSLSDAASYLESQARKGRDLGYDVLERPIEVSWIDGGRVIESWAIEMGVVND